MDETSFSYDPKEVYVMAEIGQKRVSKNIAGTGKENTTVLAVANAAGQKMPPLIVYQGNK